MKTVGLLGGMSWESTLLYYRLINRDVAERLGGLHSAKLILHSVDFAEVERLQREERWEDAGALLADAAAGLERAGAECVVICANTMHLVAPAVEARAGIPLLHVADATARAVRAAGLATVGLLGTRFTMERDFYRGRLEDTFGLGVRIPEETGRARVHDLIYAELCRGIVSDASRADLQKIVAELADAGAEAVILGCTELGMLLGADDVALPLFDTTLLHARAAVDFALGAGDAA